MLLSWCKNIQYDTERNINNNAISHLKDYIEHYRKKRHGLARLEEQISMEMSGLCTPVKSRVNPNPNLNASSISAASGTPLYIGR